MEVYGESTEQKIINASLCVLEQYGLSGTTTKKIANEANVSEVTIFRKFKNKDLLIKACKDYFVEDLLNKLDRILDFDENVETNDYLKLIFNKIVNLSDYELTIIKIALEEIDKVSIENNILLKINEKLILKLKDFFDFQIFKNRIKNVNTDVLALNVASIILQSIILWKFYGKNLNYDIEKYTNDFLSIFDYGILV